MLFLTMGRWDRHNVSLDYCNLSSVVPSVNIDLSLAQHEGLPPSLPPSLAPFLPLCLLSLLSPSSLCLLINLHVVGPACPPADLAPLHSNVEAAGQLSSRQPSFLITVPTVNVWDEEEVLANQCRHVPGFFTCGSRSTSCNFQT